MNLFKLVSYYIGVMLLLAGGLSIYSGALFYFNLSLFIFEWEIFSFNSSSIIMTLIFDWMSLAFMGLVMLISSMVLFYSTFYMSGDKFFVRFILLVYLFVLSMMFLILSPNMISILLGWDGLGLVSYCLVIYYQNMRSANAGMITILSNRVGDVAILLSISWLLNYGSWNFFYVEFMYSLEETYLVTGLVILAAMTKSAQMPFSAWLPAAMAAPTPVSALVHSSTLVTAGVYLLIRFSYLIGLSNFLFFIGALTMFMSGLGANFENDLKSIIALSTLSQLGLMMMTIGMGMAEYAYFHLMTHAMFKSLLFLCAGVFIHSMGDTQDIRSLGGLAISCPVTSFYFSCSSMALCGFPFLSGFFSKDMILELMFLSSMNLLMFIVVFVSTMFTLTYSVRLMYYIFFSNLGGRAFLSVSEETGMIVPMSFLLAMSVFAGGWMSTVLFPVSLIFLPNMFKLMVLFGILSLFILTFYFLNYKTFKISAMTEKTFYFYGSMWFLPFISSVLFMPLVKGGSGVLKFVDQGWVEFLGGQGFIKKSSVASSWVDFSNDMNLKFFLFFFFSGLLFLAALMI